MPFSTWKNATTSSPDLSFSNSLKIKPMFPNDFEAKAAALVALYTERRLTIATAESCTGGLVAGLITQVPGSSAVLDRGFVTYSNAAKVDCLGVHPLLIDTWGAVSAQTARAMAMGALAHAETDVAVSITGIAGPGGGSPDKPVGLVYLCCAHRDGRSVAAEKRYGDLGREGIRLASVATAIELLFELLR
jgi:nicotinamide-nucleotide amidase